MKLIVEKSQNLNLSQFKKKWKDEKKVLITRIFNFQKYENKKKDILLGLNFINLPKRELPNINELENLDFVIINNRELLLSFLKKKKKIIYIFIDFKKDLKYIFENFKDREKILFLKNTYFKIDINNLDNNEIFKQITFLKKEFSRFLSTEKAKRINIILSSNLPKEENIKLLNDKILKISGIIIEDENEKE